MSNGGDWEREAAHEERKLAHEERVLQVEERARIAEHENETAAIIKRIDKRTELTELAIFGVPDPDGVRKGGMLDRISGLEKKIWAILLLAVGSMAGVVATAAATYLLSAI